MLNCYHIPIYHNRAVPCRVAWLLQPCWLGTVRHGFDRVYTSNFNRTVPCRAVAYRAGTEKLCRVNGVLSFILSCTTARSVSFQTVVLTLGIKLVWVPVYIHLLISDSIVVTSLTLAQMYGQHKYIHVYR